jgi:hypothetical protein
MHLLTCARAAPQSDWAGTGSALLKRTRPQTRGDFTMRPDEKRRDPGGLAASRMRLLAGGGRTVWFVVVPAEQFCGHYCTTAAAVLLLRGNKSLSISFSYDMTYMRCGAHMYTCTNGRTRTRPRFDAVGAYSGWLGSLIDRVTIKYSCQVDKNSLCDFARARVCMQLAGATDHHRRNLVPTSVFVNKAIYSSST